jgi:hypothetical protein
MAVRLNRHAFEHAKDLIAKGMFVADQKDAWSEHQPSAADENDFIRTHDYNEFGKWHLGLNDEKDPQTRGGTNSRTGISSMSIVVRCCQQRAGQDSTNTS